MSESKNPWVCYRQGKNRRKCDTCEAETPIAHNRCKFYDPRKIPPREEQVCECGKTYLNWMSFMKHRIWCETVFVQNMGKILCDEHMNPLAVNPKFFTTNANDETREK